MLIKDLPITPEILRDLRLDANISLSELEKKTSISKDELREWEEGISRPSLGRLEKLSHFYKKPISFFFMPPQKIQTSLPTDRRMIVGAEGTFSFETKLAVRRAREIKKFGSYLSENLKTFPKLKLANYLMNSDPEKAATAERKKFEISWSEQTHWLPNDAFKVWRKYLEDLYGIFVLRLDFPMEDARGFSIVDSSTNTIVINSDEKIYARNFTLFHEFGHILLNNDGICIVEEEKEGRGPDVKIENWCNRFSAAFLLPEREFLTERALPKIADSDFESLRIFSNRTKVSGHAILIRMKTLNVVSQEKCDELIDGFNAHMKGRESKGFGINKIWATRIIGERGRLFPSLLLDGNKKGFVSFGQLSDYLGCNLKHLNNLKILLEK